MLWGFFMGRIGRNLSLREMYTLLMYSKGGFSSWSRINLLTQIFLDPVSRFLPFAITQTKTSLRPTKPKNPQQWGFSKRFCPPWIRILEPICKRMWVFSEYFKRNK